jgi:DNA-binding response OmpR family regulator
VNARFETIFRNVRTKSKPANNSKKVEVYRPATQKQIRWRTQVERPKILIVDDDPDLRRAMKIRLRANHYDTVHASDGCSAMAMAKKWLPSLIILDLGLPSGDGFEVLKHLRAADALSGIPVIVLSARGPQFNESRALQAGATAFFQKPADNRELIDAIRKVVPNHVPGKDIFVRREEENSRPGLATKNELTQESEEESELAGTIS